MVKVIPKYSSLGKRMTSNHEMTMNDVLAISIVFPLV